MSEPQLVGSEIVEVNNRMDSYPEAMRCPVIGCAAILPVDWSEYGIDSFGHVMARFTARCERHGLKITALMDGDAPYPFGI